MMGREYLEELVACERIILKLILNMLCTGFICLKMNVTGGPL
jgi:hypothetical protein